jgi:hypothetical protein
MKALMFTIMFAMISGMVFFTYELIKTPVKKTVKKTDNKAKDSLTTITSPTSVITDNGDGTETLTLNLTRPKQVQMKKGAALIRPITQMQLPQTASGESTDKRVDEQL